MVADARPGPGIARLRVPWDGHDRGGKPLILREAVRKDAARYGDLLARLVSDTHFMLQGPEDPLPTVAEHKDIIEEYHRRQNCVCIVAARPTAADEAARVVGVWGRGPGRQELVGSVTLVGGRTARVAHGAELAMGVARDAWGVGIGGLLLDAALTWAMASPNILRVSLSVYAENHVARALYLSRGFEEEGTLRRYAKWGGRYDDLVGMGLWVGSPGLEAVS